MALVLASEAPETERKLSLDHTYGEPSFYDGYLALTPDGTRLAVAGSDGVKIYDTSTGDVLATREACGWETVSLAWAPDGKTLAAGGTALDTQIRGEIVVWRPDGKALRWTTGTQIVDSLAFSPDGALLVSSTGDEADESGEEVHVPTLWDATTGKLRRRLEPYGGFQSEVAFSPDGRRVAQSSYDSSATGETRVFETATGRLLKTGPYTAPILFDKRGEVERRHIDARIQWHGHTIQAVGSGPGDRGYQLRVEVLNAGHKPHVLTILNPDDGRVVMAGDHVVAAVARHQGLSDVNLRFWRLHLDAQKQVALVPVGTFGQRTFGWTGLAIAREAGIWAFSSEPYTLLLQTQGNQVKTQKVPPLYESLSQPPSLSQDGTWLYNGYLWRQGWPLPSKSAHSRGFTTDICGGRASATYSAGVMKLSRGPCRPMAAF